MNLLFFTLVLLAASALFGYFLDIVEQSTLSTRFPNLFAFLVLLTTAPIGYCLWVYPPQW